MTRPINEKFASFRSFESSYKLGIEDIGNIVRWLFVSSNGSHKVITAVVHDTFQVLSRQQVGQIVMEVGHYIWLQRF